MKKRALLAALLLIVCLLAACGKETFTCDFCGREVTEKPHYVTVLGEEGKLCEKCYEGMQELKDLFG